MLWPSPPFFKTGIEPYDRDEVDCGVFLEEPWTAFVEAFSKVYLAAAELETEDGTDWTTIDYLAGFYLLLSQAASPNAILG